MKYANSPEVSSRLTSRRTIAMNVWLQLREHKSATRWLCTCCTQDLVRFGPHLTDKLLIAGYRERKAQNLELKNGQNARLSYCHILPSNTCTDTDVVVSFESVLFLISRFLSLTGCMSVVTI